MRISDWSSDVCSSDLSWLKRRHGVTRATAEQVIQCNGGQHGLALAFAALARPGDTILCEAATYPGLRTLAAHAGYPLQRSEERRVGNECVRTFRSRW